MARPTKHNVIFTCGEAARGRTAKAARIGELTFSDQCLASKKSGVARPVTAWNVAVDEVGFGGNLLHGGCRGTQRAPARHFAKQCVVAGYCGIGWFGRSTANRGRVARAGVSSACGVPSRLSGVTDRSEGKPV